MTDDSKNERQLAASKTGKLSKLPELVDKDGRPITDEEHLRHHRNAIYCTAAPEISTAAAVNFLTDVHNLTHFSGFHFQVADRMDQTLDLLVQSLPKDQRPALISYRPVADHYRPLLNELILTRSVSGFLTYLAQVLALIFETRPETLRSGRQVEVDYVLSFNSMSELRAAFAEDEVDRLSYQGMSHLATTIDKRIGLSLLPDPQDLREAVRIIEIRNLIVHNNAIVNRTFLRRCPEADLSVGERIPVGDALNSAVFLAYAVLDIDKRAIMKFALPTFDGDPPARMCYRI